MIVKILIYLIRFITKFIRKDRNLITLIFKGYSGSNISPLLEELYKNNQYQINVIRDDMKDTEYKGNFLKSLLFLINKYKLIINSQLIISTHGFYRLRNDSIMINLWHGIPIKGMGLMNVNVSKKHNNNLFRDDYFLSTARFFNTVMNSGLGITVDKYYIAGFPRNDYLFNQNGRKNLEKLIEMEISKKIILFMPTFREVSNIVTDDERNKNIFGFSNFDFEKFNSYLKENDLLFLLKLHPNEEKVYIEKYSIIMSDNIILLRGLDLDNKRMDLYKIINSVDVLITDYSSIYFDYLLLDRPIIFITSDLEKYKQERGFLLEPYDFWTPGPKCSDQESLINGITRSISDPLYYKNERKTIRDIFHEYQDGNSTKRVIELIDEVMRG